MYGPILEGKLGHLRPPRREDAEPFLEWFANPSVTNTLRVNNPPSLEWERRWLEERATDPDCIMWSIEMAGRLVGSTGIHEIDWRNLHARTGIVIGDPSAWGKGLASEVMRLRTAYAFTETPLRKLCSGVIDGNQASLRAQEKAGYRVVGRWHEHHQRGGRWLDEILTEIHRHDWEAAQERSERSTT